MTAPYDRPEEQGGYRPPAGYGPPAGPAAPAGQGFVPTSGPPGYVQQPQTESRAVLVLVLGIASFVVFPVIPAIVALCLAPGARRSIDASNGWKTGRGMVTGGVIASWINLALAVLSVLALVGLVVAGTASYSNGIGAPS